MHKIIGRGLLIAFYFIFKLDLFSQNQNINNSLRLWRPHRALTYWGISYNHLIIYNQSNKGVKWWTDRLLFSALLTILEHLAALLHRPQNVCLSPCEADVPLMPVACKAKVKIINVGAIEGLVGGGLEEGGGGTGLIFAWVRAKKTIMNSYSQTEPKKKPAWVRFPWKC